MTLSPTLEEGRYRLLHPVGSGGMATVWCALDQRLQAPCAIKVLNPPADQSPHARKRLLDEARIMALLRHPNITSVLSLGSESGQPFIVMELLDGSLTDWLSQRGPLAPRLAIEAICAALDGLACAHAAGVIHRDIKPGNILVGRGPVFKLTDFGLSRSSNTHAPAPEGTTGYAAPEQRRGTHAADVRSDIYAVGATLYALLTGKRPTESFTHDQLAALPAALQPVVHTATRYAPAQRYPDAEVMRRALQQAARAFPEAAWPPLPRRALPSQTIVPLFSPEAPSLAPPPPPMLLPEEPAPRAARPSPAPQRPRWIAVAAFCAALLVGLVALDSYSGRHQPERSTSALSAPVPPRVNLILAPSPTADTDTDAPLQPRDLQAPPGYVTVTGEAFSVVLVDAEGTRHLPGRLAVGAYTILAGFGRAERPMGELVVQSNQAATIRCEAATETCTVR